MVGTAAAYNRCNEGPEFRAPNRESSEFAVNERILGGATTGVRKRNGETDSGFRDRRIV